MSLVYDSNNLFELHEESPDHFVPFLCTWVQYQPGIIDTVASFDPERLLCARGPRYEARLYWLSNLIWFSKAYMTFLSNWRPR